MAGELTLGSRLDGHLKRIKIEQIDTNKITVEELRVKICDKLKVKDSDFEVIYAGRRLTDGQVNAYGVKSGVTLHILKSPHKHEPDPAEPLDKSTIPMMLTALQAALLNPAHRHLVTKILTSRDTLENIIAATPGLHADIIAQALLQTPELLINLANPDDAEEILEKHPCLIQAAMAIAAVVTEEAAKGAVKGAVPTPGSYSLDRMSDEDDYDEATVSSSSSSQPTAITTNQLAAALAAASSQSSQGQGQGQSRGIITNDFFQQAMQQAMGNVGVGATSGSGTSGNASGTSSGGMTPSPSLLESQLQQLREMGITDDAAARQALQVAGGNVQMALSILFGDVHDDMV